jgi:hypothetical protein
MTTAMRVQPRSPSASRSDSIQAELVEQYLQHLQAGEAVEPSEFAAQHPELAEDLRRFLEHKSIKARRPSVVERAAKWTRRHTTIVGAALAILAVTALVLLFNLILLRREQTKTTAALKLAEFRSRQARETVDTMYTQVAEKWLAQQPYLEPIQRAFLEATVQFYQTFAQEEHADPVLRREIARAWYRLGLTDTMLARLDNAESAYKHAIDMQSSLVAEFPRTPAIRQD